MINNKAKSVKEIKANGKSNQFNSLKDLKVEHLPFSIRILLENVLRNYERFSITDEYVQILVN